MLRTVLFLALALATAPAFGLGSEFTYQGTLTDNGAPATGSYDLQFTLQDSRANTVGSPLLLDNVAVANGVFTVQLDFGATAFTGAIRKLQIGVRPGVSTGAFTTLAPATTITPTPHALVAGNALIATTVADGAIGSAQIADDSITSTDIANSSITNLDLAANSVSSNVIADDSITAQDIAPSAVTSSELALNAVTTAKISDGAVTSVKIVDGAITAAKIADSAITSAKIATGTITDSDIASRTISGQSIGVGAIDDTNLANNAVNSAKIADGSITDFDIAQNAISGQSIANGAISNAKLAADAVSSSKIADGSVTAADAALNNFWLAGGNYNTDPATNFLGTTDGKPLQLKAGTFKMTGTTGGPGDFIETLDLISPTANWLKFSNPAGDIEGRLYGTSVGAEFYFGVAGRGGALVLEAPNSNDRALSLLVEGGGNLRLSSSLTGTTLSLIDGLSGHSVIAEKPGGGPWSAPSDIRLKHNVQPLVGALDHLLQLRSVTFEYNDAGKGRFPEGVQTGFVAQEVQQVFPDWVNAGPDGYLLIGSKGFESLAVQALRELRAEKDDEITALKDENTALRARIEAIEARMGNH